MLAMVEVVEFLVLLLLPTTVAVVAVTEIQLALALAVQALSLFATPNLTQPQR